MKYHQKKSTTRKCSFLLFEIMVALMLIVLLFFPLIKTQLGISKSQRSRQIAQCSDRKAREAFCELKAKLFEREISFPSQGLLNNIAYDIAIVDSVHKRSQERHYYLLQVKLHMEEPKATYQFPLIAKSK